jgi:uncharacterized protein YrrD
VGHFLRTFSSLKGLPVFDTCTGSRLGEVCDLCITGKGEVNSLLIKMVSLFSVKKQLPIGSVESFGTDGIMTRKKYLHPFCSDKVFTFVHRKPIEGILIFDKNGETLGRLKDVYFLENLGMIVGYQLTDGFFSDLLEGNKIIQTKTPPAIGKDAIIVTTERVRGGCHAYLSKLPK